MTVVPHYTSISDASSGPLTPGDIGILERGKFYFLFFYFILFFYLI